MTSNPRDMRDWMRQVERLAVQQRGIPALIQGSVEVIRDESEKDKLRHPAAPIELTYQTAEYLDVNSRRRVRFLMDFPDVVFNTDATDAQIQQYELWAKDETPSALHTTTNSVPSQSLPGATLPGLASTAPNEAIAAEEKPWVMRDTSTQSFFRTDGFIPNSIWRFRVRAIGVNTVTPGEWSEEIVVQMLADDTPPPMPTAPKLLVQRGTITVSWDGQSVSGSMPPDFKYAILAHGTSSSPTFEIARFGRGGGFKVVADIEYYDPQFFRLRAVDESGNMGPWSEQAVGFTTPLVDKDVILSTIDGAKTYLKNIDARTAILDGTILTEHLVVTEEMTAAIANFLVVNADMINANSIWADEAFFGLADALLFRGDAFEGKSFTGGIFTGGRFQTDVEEYAGIKVDPSGILAYSATGGNETFRLDAATGNLTANYGTLTGLVYQTHSAANTGIKIDATNGIRSYNASNQLNFSISPSGASFTGTVTSGFGSTRALLSDNIFDSRPGISLKTGTTYYADPFLISYGTSAPMNFQKGSLFASAAWTSSGADPGRLWMASEGSFSLGGAHGSVGTVGYGVIQMQAGGNKSKIYLGDNSYIQAVNSASLSADADGEVTMSTARGQYIRSAPGGAIILHTSNIWLQTNNDGTSINGGLTVYGSKNFVMEHPTKPGLELLHGATESPVSGIEYWGEGVVGAGGEGVIELPEYFEALAKPEGRVVLVTGRGGVLDWTDVIDGQVTVYGNEGTKYSWLVKAERFGGDFDVEREKPEAPTMQVPAE